MGDAISHAVLPGIVLAFLAGIPLVIGAFVSGIACALGVGYLKENSRIKEDTAMGIVFSGMFAIGLVLFTKIQTSQHLTHILFGNVLGVSRQELIQTTIIALIIFILLGLKRRDFLLYCFDPSHARVAGLSPKLLHYGLLTLLALTIVSTMQVVGVILVVAMLIAPGITALTLTNRFDKMLVIAIISAVTAMSPSTNKLNVLEYTLYQLYDEHSRLYGIEGYKMSVKASMYGGNENSDWGAPQ